MLILTLISCQGSQQRGEHGWSGMDETEMYLSKLYSSKVFPAKAVSRVVDMVDPGGRGADGWGQKKLRNSTTLAAH